MGRKSSPIKTPVRALDPACPPPEYWQLTCVDRNGNRLPTIRVGEEPIRIGRHPRVDYVLSSSTVSKEHAEILAVGPTVFVRDLESRNGTYVNDRRVTSITPLGRGDQVRIGDVVFEVSDDQGESSGTPFSLTATSLSLDHWLTDSFNELLTEGGLRVVFQPIVAVDSKQIFGFEALARCDVDGIDTPTKLFSLASRLNMACQLSHLCRFVAATEARRVRTTSPIFLNTSQDEVLNADLIASLRTIRDTFPELDVVVEINEDCITAPEEVVRFHDQLHELQYRLAFDDFGTGQSRIRELMRILPEYVKFDRTVVHELHKGNRHEQSLVRSFVTLFRDLGIQTIAESVECQDCLESCQEAGFDFCQGFHTGVPASIQDWLPLGRSRRDTIEEMDACPM